MLDPEFVAKVQEAKGQSKGVGAGNQNGTNDDEEMASAMYSKKYQEHSSDLEEDNVSPIRSQQLTEFSGEKENHQKGQADDQTDCSGG